MSKSFVCPNCQKPELAIVVSLRLPADDFADESAHQILKCKACGFEGLARFEESRRGREPRSHHTGYKSDPGELRTFRKLLNSCPDPEFRHCDCEAHAKVAAHAFKGESFRLVWEKG